MAKKWPERVVKWPTHRFVCFFTHKTIYKNNEKRWQLDQFMKESSHSNLTFVLHTSEQAYFINSWRKVIQMWNLDAHYNLKYHLNQHIAIVLEGKKLFVWSTFFSFLLFYFKFSLNDHGISLDLNRCNKEKEKYIF